MVPSNALLRTIGALHHALHSISATMLSLAVGAGRMIVETAEPLSNDFRIVRTW